MGIFGLTSYVSKHKSEFLTDFKLFNRPILIDGNSSASLIYGNLTQSNHAFGGDYDKYARSTRDFVQLLKKCGITPIFIFDGGYEQRKLKTVLERIKMNIIVCGQYKNKYRESKTFPLMLRDTFRIILNDLKVAVVQCDFEADNELVVLSRILNCPLISYDSDFCLTDSLYIPFTSIDFQAVRLKKKSAKCKYFLSCQIFNVDAFLNRFGGSVDKSLLPLLSCALGNDYIPPNTFGSFLQLNHTVSFEERVTKIVQWMTKITSVDESINEMISFVDKNKHSVKNNIENLIADYNRRVSYLLDYIPEEIVEKVLSRDLMHLSLPNCEGIMGKPDKPATFLHDQSDGKNSLNDVDEEIYVDSDDDDVIVLEVEEYEILCSDDESVEGTNDDESVEGTNDDERYNDSKINFSESVGSESIAKCTEYELLEKEMLNSADSFANVHFENTGDDSMLQNVNKETDDTVCLVDSGKTLIGKKMPNWFVEKYRRGIMNPNLINVINFQRFFIPSQSEDYFSKPSHEICLDILTKIIGIILGADTNVSKIKCHARCKSMHLGVYDIIPVFEVLDRPLPTLSTITSMSTEVRTAILMDCLDVPANIKLSLFPNEWKLFVIILMYWKKRCKQPVVNSSHIRAVVVCMIYLNIIDHKIGFARVASDIKRMKKERKRLVKLSEKTASVVDEDVSLPDENSLSVKINSTVIDGNQPLICENASLVNKNELFTDEHDYSSVDNYLDLIMEEDCYKAATVLLNYHQVNPDLLKNRKEFDQKIIHAFAQLQHCIQSISTLNSVLDFPLPQCRPHLCFSGTFLYNLYSELNRRKLADGYITRTLLAKATTIIALYRYLITSWEAIATTKVVRPKFEMGKRKKKVEPSAPQIHDKECEIEAYHDPYNIYSMLPEE